MQLSKGIPLGSMTTPTEEPLWLAAARQGEPDALEWLFQTYHQSVYSLCYRLLARAEDAEDATQATFVGAFRGIASFRGAASLKTWLYRIAVNESLSLLRQRLRDPDRLDESWLVAEGEQDVIQKAAVAVILRRMRPDQRLILILYYWEDLSCDEIAAVLDVSIPAAKMRLKRARDEFQRQYGGEP